MRATDYYKSADYQAMLKRLRQRTTPTLPLPMQDPLEEIGEPIPGGVATNDPDDLIKEATS